MIFNVSVGDFICLINVIIEILSALEQSHGAGAQFQDLMGAVESLKCAIEEADALDCKSEGLSAALNRAESCVERFLKKTERYQPSLRAGGTKNKWNDAILKIQWALFRKEDVNAFRAEILMHLNSIHVLLLSATRAALVAERKEIIQMRTYMMSADARLNETRALVATLNKTLSQCASKLQHLLQSILRTNITILNAVIFARFGVNIPMSVALGHAVNFQDATGRRLPIPVGFIDCWDSFQHILLNLHRNRAGFHAVESHNYRLQDASSNGKWTAFEPNQRFEEVFAPDGYIDMTVVFPYDPDGDFVCPKCGEPEGVVADYSKVECPNPECDLNYSKSDYLQTNIYTLSPHFDLPPIPVILSEAEKAAVAKELKGGIVCQSTLEADEDAQVLSDQDAPDLTALPHLRSTAESIADFQNIYINKPAAVSLRDHQLMWFMDIPWRVAQSFNGIQFIINHYTASRNITYKLRDREVGWGLNESNWTARAWPGMVILIERTSGVLGQAPRRHSPTDAACNLRCLLCRKTFASDKALRKHTASTHLTQRLCPQISVCCALCASPTT